MIETRNCIHGRRREKPDREAEQGQVDGFPGARYPGREQVNVVALVEAERHALLVSARVLMDEALLLLDRGGSSIAAVWLGHAIECLDLQGGSAAQPSAVAPVELPTSFDAAAMTRRS